MERERCLLVWTEGLALSFKTGKQSVSEGLHQTAGAAALRGAAVIEFVIDEDMRSRFLQCKWRCGGNWKGAYVSFSLNSHL